MLNPSRLSTRRAFLQKGLGFVSASAMIPVWLDQTAFALEAPDDVKQPGARPGGKDGNILIVLQLSGGNDVLSSIVPHGLDDYYRLRRVTAIRKNEVIKINDKLGMHPNMRPLKSMYDAGDMAVVQGVSYPNPNRSHFQSMAIWHSCDARNPDLSDGWLARYFEEEAKSKKLSATAAISLGNEAPKALIGRKFRGISFQDPRSFTWRGDGRNPELTKTYRELNKMEKKSGNSNLDFLATTAMEANAATDAVKRAVSKFRPTGRYQGRLGRDMATVAAMIAGGLKTKLYYVRQGGYDTHSGQRNRHNNLMNELSRNVAALRTDLKKIGVDKRVVIMCFSEFGRRVQENASGGTDHGAAGSMFLWGPAVKGGIFGDHPSLTELDRGDLKWSVDFRQVYSTVIDKWLGGNATNVLGKKFDHLKIL